MSTPQKQRHYLSSDTAFNPNDSSDEDAPSGPHLQQETTVRVKREEIPRHFRRGIAPTRARGTDVGPFAMTNTTTVPPALLTQQIADLVLRAGDAAKQKLTRVLKDAVRPRLPLRLQESMLDCECSFARAQIRQPYEENHARSLKVAPLPLIERPDGAFFDNSPTFEIRVLTKSGCVVTFACDKFAGGDCVLKGEKYVLPLFHGSIGRNQSTKTEAQLGGIGVCFGQFSQEYVSNNFHPFSCVQYDHRKI